MTTINAPSSTSQGWSYWTVVNPINQWRIGGQVVGQLVEEVRTWDSMSLTFRTSKQELVDVFRPELDQAGKLDTIVRSDGGFNTEDRARGANTVEIQSPDERGHIRPVDTWHVEEYTEEPQDREAESWEVEVTLVPDQEKAYDNEYGTLDAPPPSPTPPGAWYFEFDFGEISTRRVTMDVERQPDGTAAGAEIEMFLLSREVRILEESSSKLEAVNYREVPDGDDLVEDVTEGRNTVGIRAPAGGEETIQTGRYAVMEWETVWNRSILTVTLTVAWIDDAFDPDAVGLGRGQLGLMELGVG